MLQNDKGLCMKLQFSPRAEHFHLLSGLSRSSENELLHSAHSDEHTSEVRICPMARILLKEVVPRSTQRRLTATAVVRREFFLRAVSFPMHTSFIPSILSQVKLKIVVSVNTS